MTDILLIVVIIGLSMTGWAYFTYRIVKVVALMRMTSDGQDVKRLLRLLDGKTPINPMKGSGKPATQQEDRTPDDIGEEGMKILRKLQDPLKAVDDEMEQSIKDVQSIV